MILTPASQGVHAWSATQQLDSAEGPKLLIRDNLYLSHRILLLSYAPAKHGPTVQHNIGYSHTDGETNNPSKPVTRSTNRQNIRYRHDLRLLMQWFGGELEGISVLEMTRENCTLPG